MRIAFAGKGGSGKTTWAAVLSRYVAERGCRRVVATDADINQRLAQALGYDSPSSRTLGADLTWLKAHLRVDNPRIASVESMINTTPAGAGSRLLGLDPDDAVLRRFATRVGGVHHLAAGEFDESGIAVSCFGAKTGAVELYLNHPLDGPGKHVVVDMTAGADAFAFRTAQPVRPRDCAADHRGTVEFHRRNTHAWAKQAAGAHLMSQVDLGFLFGPRAPLTAS